MRITPLSLYLHFPYCDIKCAYCDFYSLPKRTISSTFFDEYIKHLKQDFFQKKKMIKMIDKVKVVSIFFGGGTPSKLPPHYLKEIINFIKNHLHISSNIEITLEANPESLKKKNMEVYLAAGINRLSIGIQTKQPELLRYLGRLYLKNSYLTIFDQVRQSGFHNYSIDIIYGIPSQKEFQIKEDIDWAISGGVKHISTYCLMIEKETLLEKQIKQKQKNSPSIRRQTRHYNWVTNYLPTQGFKRYEISNFAQAGYESHHNMFCWRYLPYLGLGVSAHSFIEGQRLISEKNLNYYLNGKYFYKEQSQINPDFFIGIFRILTYQSFYSLKRVLNKDEFDKLYLKLIIFQKKSWIKFYKNGFQITDIGANFSNTMVYEASL